MYVIVLGVIITKKKEARDPKALMSSYESYTIVAQSCEIDHQVMN